MWGTRKNKGKTLDTMILSILNENRDGLTGYAVVKQLEQMFYPIPMPGTGTIYPRLNKLVEQGDLIMEENLYRITDQGQEKIHHNIESILDDSLKYTRVFLRGLLENLPIAIRTQYMGNIPKYFSFFSDIGADTPTSSHKETDTIRRPIFTSDFFHCNHTTSQKIAPTLSDLKLARERLVRAKRIIREKAEREIEGINQQLEDVENQINELKEQMSSWTKIPIEDDNEN